MVAPLCCSHGFQGFIRYRGRIRHPSALKYLEQRCPTSQSPNSLPYRCPWLAVFCSNGTRRSGARVDGSAQQCRATGHAERFPANPRWTPARNSSPPPPPPITQEPPQCRLGLPVYVSSWPTLGFDLERTDLILNLASKGMGLRRMLGLTRRKIPLESRANQASFLPPSHDGGFACALLGFGPVLCVGSSMSEGDISHLCTNPLFVVAHLVGHPPDADVRQQLGGGGMSLRTSRTL